MAEDRKADIDDGTFVEKKSKVDQEMDSRYSEENSAGSSEADDNIQHRGNDETRHKKGRRPRRLKGGKRHNRKHHPYGGTSSSTMKGGTVLCPHAPRNTTQYLIDDHVKHNISPDLSNRSSPAAYNYIDEAAEFNADLQDIQIVQKERRGVGLRVHPNLALVSGAPGESPQFDRPTDFQDDYEKKLYDMPRNELVQITSALLRSGKRSSPGSKDLKEESERDSPNIDSLFNMLDSPNTTPLSSWN
ncbi:hypothetical protein ACOMHN_061852 [Nucella lapillus]